MSNDELSPFPQNYPIIPNNDKLTATFGVCSTSYYGMFDLISPTGLRYRNWCNFGVKPEHKAIFLSINNNQILLAQAGSSSWMELRQIQKQLAQQGIRAAWFAENCPETPPDNHPIWESGIPILSEQEKLFYEEGPDELRWLDVSKELPLFQYQPATPMHTGKIILPGKEFPVQTFIDMLLDGQVHYCSQTRLRGSAELFIRLFIYPCWKCNRKSWVYILNKFTDQYNNPQFMTTVCGQMADIEWVNWQTNLTFHPQTVEFVQTIINHDFPSYPMSVIKERYSKTAECAYLSFGCPSCDSLFGQHFIDELDLIPLAKTDTNCFWITLFFDEFPLILDKQRHWCCSEAKLFCQTDQY